MGFRCSCCGSSVFFFFLFLSYLVSGVTSSSSYLHHRHLLHQPFFPITPSLSSPPPQPKYPFTTSSPPTPQNPFFPESTFSKPPPPPATPLVSFPVSDLLFPQNSTTSSSSTPVSSKLIATIVSISLLALFLIVLLAFILHRRRRNNATVPHKPLGSESLDLPSPTITFTSDGTVRPIPPLRTGRGLIGTSTEFLYLGTILSPKVHEHLNSKSVVKPQLAKPTSPELRPLPPLPKFHYFTSGEQAGSSRNNQRSDDEEENETEEFFSPRGSSGNKDSFGRIDSPRGTSKILRFVEDEILANGSRSFKSKTASFPSPNSSPPSISDDLLTSLPEIELGRSRILPARVSDAVEQSLPVKLPPRPLPMRPLRHWETEDDHKISELSSSQRPNTENVEGNEETPKIKLKPLHWDKLRASSERTMAWDQIKSSSFQLNEEMIVSLITMNSSNAVLTDGLRRNVLPFPNKENRVLDTKKSQNIAILLRALNVTTDEVCEALSEGNTDALGSELLEGLLKMAPTKEEEQKLKKFRDESPVKLVPAEKFLKALLEIPFAFERMKAMLYLANFDPKVEYLKQSFQTLEAACWELKKSKMFLRLLEAVLKAGNKMNVGTTHGDTLAFKLDTLLELVGIKGTDGKTTLLHFVVQEIIGDEGPSTELTQPFSNQDDTASRKCSLQVVMSLIGELLNVKEAADIDFSSLSNEVIELASGSTKVSHALKLCEDISADESSLKFTKSMTDFIQKAKPEISTIQFQQNVAFTLVKEVTEYFHGDSAKEEAHPFRIFLLVRDFLSILDHVCKDVEKRNERTILGSGSVHCSFPPNRNMPSMFPVVQRMHRSFPGERSSSSFGNGLSPSLSL